MEHASVKYLEGIPSINLSFKISSLEPCNVCHLSKQQRNPFPRSITIVDNIFDFIHVDSWGPCVHYSILGTPFFVTLVDDRTRAVWIYFIKHKS